jgi:hypothetical protein
MAVVSLSDDDHRTGPLQELPGTHRADACAVTVTEKSRP